MMTRVSHKVHVLCLLVLLAVEPVFGQELECSPASKLINGSLLVCRQGSAKSMATHVLVHFHGAPETTKAAFARSGLDAVLVIVNFPGLSSAYSKPFQQDRQLFRHILELAKTKVPPLDGMEAAEQWSRVTVSSFSAGYGAVREILKMPEDFANINDIVMADSIYAGLQQEEPVRLVSKDNMAGFLQFASMAVEDKKAFILSHSAQPTPYASTTETANYLLKSLKINRQPQITTPTALLRQTSMASRGHFLVLGFDGETGKAHMQHLHSIDLLWKRLPKLPVNAAKQ